MKRFIPIFVVAVVAVLICACSSDKKKLSVYLEKFYPEYVVSGDQVTTDSAFCPLNKLEENANELDVVNLQLYSLYGENPDSARNYARQLKEKFGDAGNLVEPTGSKNRLAYTVKCKSDDGERLIIFYKNKKDDNIECCSLDAIQFTDSIISRHSQLMYNIGVILKDKATPEKAEEKKAEKKEEKVEEKAEEKKEEKSEEKETKD